MRQPRLETAALLIGSVMQRYSRDPLDASRRTNARSILFFSGKPKRRGETGEQVRAKGDQSREREADFPRDQSARYRGIERIPGQQATTSISMRSPPRASVIYTRGIEPFVPVRGTSPSSCRCNHPRIRCTDEAEEIDKRVDRIA